MEVSSGERSEALHDGSTTSTHESALHMQRQRRRMQMRSTRATVGASNEAVQRAQKRRRRAAKRATLIARAIWVLAHVLILAAIVFSRSQVHNDFNAGRPGPIILAFFLIGINFWLYMWVSFSNPGIVEPPCSCPHSRTGCQHARSTQTGLAQASAPSENASGTIASTRSLAPPNPPDPPSAAASDSHWHTPASTPNRRESLASVSTTNQTPTTWQTARMPALDSPSGLSAFPHPSPHSYGRVPVTDDADDERFHDDGSVHGPRMGRDRRALRLDAALGSPSPLGSPRANRRASEDSVPVSEHSTALQSRGRSSSLPHRALDGTGPLGGGDDDAGSPYVAASPLAATASSGTTSHHPAPHATWPRPPPLDMHAFGRPSPRGPSPLGVSPTSSPRPPYRAVPLPPPHLRGPGHPGPIAEARSEISPACDTPGPWHAVRSVGAPGPIAEARLPEAALDLGAVPCRTRRGGGAPAPVAPARTPHTASAAHVHPSALKSGDASVASRHASSPVSMRASTMCFSVSDMSGGSSPTAPGIPCLPNAVGMAPPAASVTAAAALPADQEVAAVGASSLDVLHLGRVFARSVSKSRMGAVAPGDGTSDALNASSRLSSPKVAAAVAAVTAGALASSSSLRTSASQSFRARDAVSSGLVVCGTTCVRGEWPIANSVVRVLQRGARSMGRWLTFFAGFRFDNVSTTDDEDALLDLDLVPQRRSDAAAACGCGGRGCSSCQDPRPAPSRRGGGCADGVRCGCICALSRGPPSEAAPPPGPVGEGRFGRGDRNTHASARESRGQPSVVPEYGASLAGFGSDQMDLMGGMFDGMELETLTPHRPRAAAPKNPFVDFGVPMEGAPVVRGAESGPHANRQQSGHDDPLARPPDMPAVDGGEVAMGLPRRNPAHAVGKALRSAASKLGGATSTSPERRQLSRRRLAPTQPARAATPDPLAADGAADESADPVVITIPDDGDAEPAASAAGDTGPLERRSPFEAPEASAQHPARSAATRPSSQAESGGSGGGRRESDGHGGALACTLDVRRNNLQRSLALSQRSLSRMSIAEAPNGPPPDWYSRTNPGRVCPYCDLWQPLRAKHCHDCGHCVRRFDHHCAWIGTCVGQHNHRLFFAYLTAQLALLTWAAIQLVSALTFEEDWEVWLLHQLHLLLAMPALLLFYLFVFGLWLYHVYLALTNQTTYEASFRDRVPYLKDLPEHHLPFSSSVCMNLQQFCLPDPDTIYTIKVGR